MNPDKTKRVYPISKPRKRKAVKIQYQSTSTFFKQHRFGYLKEDYNQYPAYAFKSDDSHKQNLHPVKDQKKSYPAYALKSDDSKNQLNPLSYRTLKTQVLPMLLTPAMMAKPVVQNLLKTKHSFDKCHYPGTESKH